MIICYHTSSILVQVIKFQLSLFSLLLARIRSMLDLKISAINLILKIRQSMLKWLILLDLYGLKLMEMPFWITLILLKLLFQVIKHILMLKHWRLNGLLNQTMQFLLNIQLIELILKLRFNNKESDHSMLSSYQYQHIFSEWE